VRAARPNNELGLAVTPGGTGVYFVDDDTNSLNLLN
jgi:hypothetical protein